MQVQRVSQCTCTCPRTRTRHWEPPCPRRRPCTGTRWTARAWNSCTGTNAAERGARRGRRRSSRSRRRNRNRTRMRWLCLLRCRRGGYWVIRDIVRLCRDPTSPEKEDTDFEMYRRDEHPAPHPARWWKWRRWLQHAPNDRILDAPARQRAARAVRSRRRTE